MSKFGKNVYLNPYKKCAVAKCRIQCLFLPPRIIKIFIYISSDTIQSEQTRSSSENLPFSISRLLSKPFENNNKTTDKEITDENKLGIHLGLPYTTSGSIYSYPLYPPGHVLRVPPQRNPCTPLSWALPPLHPAALAHQAVKDRLAGKFYIYFIPFNQLPNPIIIHQIYKRPTLLVLFEMSFVY